MQMSSRYVRCAPNAVDDRSRDHHAEDRRFWGRASGPSSSGKTLHGFHPLLARPCRLPRTLPRERFSPLAQSRLSRPITTDTRRIQRDGDRRHSTRSLCPGISEEPVLVVFVFALFLHQSALHHRLSAVRSLLQPKLQSPRKATRVRRMTVPARSVPSSARPPR